MSIFDTTVLDNGIRLILKKNANTPRTAISIFADSGAKCESKAGIATLTGRLLLQGTDKKNAETLAKELDSNAIEVSVSTKQDYIKIQALFLNEDFDKTLDILAEIIKHSTFRNFDREVKKLKGEIEVDLDSTRAKAVDNLVRNIYPNHPYGNSHTRIIEDLPNITQDMVKDFYKFYFSPEKLNIVVVGDIDKENTVNALKSRFGDIQKTDGGEIKLPEVEIAGNKLVTIVKNDAAQAQIVQGWIVPGILSEDMPALTLMNMILGSSGLSSRLFVELRDKKGLAYTVRSSYDPLKYSGVFNVYIATAPGNINTALEGFNAEIKKLQDEPVSEKELENAKSNYLGKRAFHHETNSNQAHYLGYYDIVGLGAGYDDIIQEKIKHVTTDDIKKLANKYFSLNSVTSILAPEKDLAML